MRVVGLPHSERAAASLSEVQRPGESLLSLFTWQREGIAWLQQTPRALLADDPGMGKTRQLLEAASGRTLVIAPAYADAVWEYEQSKWRPDLDLTFCSYSSLCERTENEKGHRVVATKQPREHLAGDWDTIIADEAHLLKNRKAKWTAAASKLRSERLFLATGTPIPNWSHELWMLLRLLRPDDIETRSYWRWIDRWFRTWKPQWGGTTIEGLRSCRAACADEETCEHWVEFMQENLGDAYLRRKEEDHWLERPPLTQQTLRVSFTQQTLRDYNKLRRDFRAYVEEMGREVVAWSNADLVNAMRQVCAVPKINAMAEILATRTLPAVVFCWHKATARAVAEKLEAAGHRVTMRTGDQSRTQQDAAARAMQAGECDVLVTTLATSSESITLTNAATCVFVEHSFKPSTNRQAMKRLHRLGQTRPVSVLHLMTRDSYDEPMLRMVTEKKDHALRALRAADLARLL